MTRTSNPCAVVLAFAAIAASGTAMAANTITFSGEVTDQTCQVAVNGFTDPTVILDSVPVSALDGAVGRSAGETAFTPMSSTLEIIHKYHIISAQISAWEKP
ncbi:fimbrial protein, partial [Pseudomonas aeruginosa]|uniref:fimbrial protein n=1 Tax=Pseudomonas aeruginosa TaxID=287 RepID=UPI003D353C80